MVEWSLVAALAVGGAIVIVLVLFGKEWGGAELDAVRKELELERRLAKEAEAAEEQLRERFVALLAGREEDLHSVRARALAGDDLDELLRVSGWPDSDPAPGESGGPAEQGDGPAVG